MYIVVNETVCAVGSNTNVFANPVVAFVEITNPDGAVIFMLLYKVEP